MKRQSFSFVQDSQLVSIPFQKDLGKDDWCETKIKQSRAEDRRERLDADSVLEKDIQS